VIDQDVSRASRLVAAGYVLAVLMPPIGFAIGVVLVNNADKRAVKHGLWTIALAVVAAFVLFVVLIISTHSTLGEGSG
jgi:ABC-type spermidine/putrescine transport system permease subunit II